MHNLISAFPLYNFLKYCNDSPLEKVILDCGAGGINPPLSLFYEFGYKTYGIELSKEQLEKANAFCAKRNTDLNMILGDMKKIPFEDASFSFLYSYNTSVHMRKTDFQLALAEFHRVLRRGGLCYVNFLGTECDTYGTGRKIGEGEFLQSEDSDEVLFCHYKDTEVEQFLNGFEVLYKEKRLIRRKIDDSEITSSYLDYILMKK